MPRTRLPLVVLFVGLAACDGGSSAAVGEGGTTDGTVQDGPGADSSDAGAVTSESGSDAPADADAQDTGTDGGTPCDLVTGPWIYVVDPVAGSDGPASTGSGTSKGIATPSCALKTITHALQVVLAANNPPKLTTWVTVQGPSTVSKVANGETFPITVPDNVTIVGTGGTFGDAGAGDAGDAGGDGGAGGVTVTVTSGDGLALSGQNSSLDSLALDGAAHLGARAVVVTGKNVNIARMLIEDFASDCVAVENGGALGVHDDVTIRGCGTANSRRSGISATGTGWLFADGQAQHPVVLEGNTAYGIKVEGSAQLTIKSLLGNAPPGSANVRLVGNALGNLFIQQTPNPNNPPPLCMVDGAAFAGATGAANADGDGVRVFGGSQLRLRGSYVLENRLNGVLVASYPQNVSGASDLSGIDLGSNQWGLNVMQDTIRANGAAGICVDLAQGNNQSLNAFGNIFASNIDCSSGSAALTKGTCTPGSKTHVGIAGSQMVTLSTSMCTN